MPTTIPCWISMPEKMLAAADEAGYALGLPLPPGSLLRVLDAGCLGARHALGTHGDHRHPLGEMDVSGHTPRALAQNVRSYGWLGGWDVPGSAGWLPAVPTDGQLLLVVGHSADPKE